MSSQNSSRSLVMPTPVRVPIALKKDVTPFWSTPGTRVNILRPLASVVALIVSITWTCQPTCPTIRTTGSGVADSLLLATRKV